MSLKADDRNRTCNPLITNQELYLLSYISKTEYIGLEPIRRLLDYSQFSKLLPYQLGLILHNERGGNWTHDTLIKSQVPYLLATRSYYVVKDKTVARIERTIMELQSTALPLCYTVETGSEGFEPSEGCPSTVFKTAAISHSANSPNTLCLEEGC